MAFLLDDQTTSHPTPSLMATAIVI